MPALRKRIRKGGQRTREELSENDEMNRLSEPEPYPTELSDIYSWPFAGRNFSYHFGLDLAILFQKRTPFLPPIRGRNKWKRMRLRGRK